MGEAKRRRAEIEKLKNATPEQTARWKRSKVDEAFLSHGIDAESRSPDPTAAMARQLWALFDKAKTDGDIDAPVKYLQAKIDGTLLGMSDVPIACRNGCSHCCNIWVSVSAPEVLSISRLVIQRGTQAIEKVRRANEQTKYWDFDHRDEHPVPCPLLENNSCSIYQDRPKACRQAASADAEICARSYNDLTVEDIPTPVLYLMSRSNYAAAMAVALRKAGLPHRAYEFNAALVRAIDTENAVARWLGGEDIFDGVPFEAGDIFDNPQMEKMFQYAFEGMS